MSYLQVSAARASLQVPDQFNTSRGLAAQRIGPVNMLNIHTALKPSIGSAKRCTELMKCNIMQKTGATSYQQYTPVCSFGGKGDTKNGNEGSPWKAIEKAMSSFKKEQSLEDVLRQQMEKQEYYDGDPPSGGGGGGGGGGFGGTEDEGFAGLLDDILQVTLAIIALVVLYLNIIAGDQVKLFIADTFDFLSGKKGPRLRTIMYEFAQFYQKCRARVPYDPYWLEKEILTTPTWWDSPEKYRRMLHASNRSIKSSKGNIYSDSDENAYGDNSFDDEDSDNDRDYNKKAYNDDDEDEDDNGYSEDVDDDY